MKKAQSLRNDTLAADKLTAELPLFKFGIAKPKKSKPTFEQRFRAKVSTIPTATGCLEWLGAPDTCSLGYGRISRGDEHLYAHRVAYELEHGHVPAGAYVRHTCDNPICVNPAHLIAGIPADNTADMVAKGRQRRNLTKAEVVEIDRLDRDGDYWTEARLARKFKVSTTSIRRLLSGATWSKVTGRKTKPHRASTIIQPTHHIERVPA